jgi:prevent-host-death family protein
MGSKNMEKVNISTLRENLSIFLKKVQKGQVITITSRGHEMAKLVPVEDKREKSREILRKLGEKAIIGDILSPIDEEWEAMK